MTPLHQSTADSETIGIGAVKGLVGSEWHVAVAEGKDVTGVEISELHEMLESSVPHFVQFLHRIVGFFFLVELWLVCVCICRGQSNWTQKLD